MRDCDTVVKQKMIKRVRLILAGNDYENNVPLKKKTRLACNRFVHQYDVLAKLKLFVEIKLFYKLKMV